MNRAAKAKIINRGFAIVLLTGMLLSPKAYGQSYSYPLKLSNNSRHLVDQSGKPFFWMGDSAWSLIAQLSREDAALFLEDRRQKGFSVVMASLIEHQFSSNPPRNYYGTLPFSGQNFTTPNESYFAHADYVISQAAQRGIIVLLFPLYLGYGCGSQGWCAEVASASMSDMRAWGRYVGNRYRNYDNIVWAIGGDTDPTPVRDKVREFVNGVRDNDTRHLFTTHNQPESFAITPWPNESWLNINNVYSYSYSLYQYCAIAYNRSPVMPFFLLESTYENEHGATAVQLRMQAYWPPLTGGIGSIFGNCPIWHFGSAASWCGSTNWKGQLSSPGSVSMMYVQKLFTSREWHLLVPDLNHTAMTAGYGSWGDSSYVTAALTSNGHTLIAYLTSSRQVTVDMSKISGTQARGWWYKPADGTTTPIGVFATSGSRGFTPPSSGDWVLVVDDASLNLPAPGTQIYPPAPPTGLKIIKHPAGLPGPR